MVDLAMVDAAGVDIERHAEFGLAHHRAFEVPARRAAAPRRIPFHLPRLARRGLAPDREIGGVALALDLVDPAFALVRSEEHTSELQSLMRISYAVFCLKKKQKKTRKHIIKQ